MDLQHISVEELPSAEFMTFGFALYEDVAEFMTFGFALYEGHLVQKLDGEVPPISSVSCVPHYRYWQADVESASSFRLY